MNTTPNREPELAFSNTAILRGAAASALCAYLVFALAYPPLLFARNLFEPGTLPELLNNAVQPANLLTGAVFFSAIASVGLVVLVLGKRDHTTFGAAARAGALTAALVFGLICLIAIVFSLFNTLAERPEELLTPHYWAMAPTLIWFGVVIISSGALAGLIFRAAAGAPTRRRATNA